MRQKFASYERDYETGLDFVQARYYASAHGRFTSPDEFLCSGRPNSPQTWNRYVYVLNNPLAYTDPTGFYEYAEGTDEKYKKRFEAQLKRAYDQLSKIEKRYGAQSVEYLRSRAALDAYGGANVKNGVIVQFGAVKEGTPGGTEGFIGTDGNKSITVTIDMDKNKADNLLLGTIAHEGSHVQDHAYLVDGVLNASSAAEATGIASSITVEATETMSYMVESVFAEFTYKNEQTFEGGGGRTTMRPRAEQEYAVIRGTKNPIWNPSWAGADVAKVRASRSKAIAQGLSESSLYKDRLKDPIWKIQ